MRQRDFAAVSGPDRFTIGFFRVGLAARIFTQPVTVVDPAIAAGSDSLPVELVHFGGPFRLVAENPAQQNCRVLAAARDGCSRRLFRGPIGPEPHKQSLRKMLQPFVVAQTGQNVDQCSNSFKDGA